MKQILFFISFLSFTPQLLLAQLPAAGIMVKKIWDQGEHNAFTDLIRFKGKFYCTFREGSGHVPGKDGTGDGMIRILVSDNGDSWESVVLLEKEGVDLRDPKLSVMPNGTLMVTIGGSLYRRGVLEGRQPYVAFSDEEGRTFSNPEPAVVDKQIVTWSDWIWRVTWHNGVGYAIDYQIGSEERNVPYSVYLVKTTDGKHYTKVSKLEIADFPNESTIRFHKDGTMYVMVRIETGDKLGVMATSKAPYTDWQYKKMNIRLGGPNFIFAGKGKMIAGTRMHNPDVYTGLLVSEDRINFREVLHFPSAGDNSYPGLLIYKKYLWVTYYSTHEGKSAIYLSKIPYSFIKRQF